MSSITPEAVPAEAQVPDLLAASSAAHAAGLMESQAAAGLPGSQEIASQTEPAPVHSYRHANGEVFSGTIGEARKVCPALGGLSLESAERLVRLRELAQQKIAEKKAAEAKEAEPRPKPSGAKPQKPEPAKAKEKPMAEPAVKEPATQPPVAEQARQVAAVEPEPAVQPSRIEPVPVVPLAVRKAAEAELITAPPIHHQPPEVVRAEVLAPKLDPVALIPPPELLMPTPMETQPFERIFPEEIAVQQDVLTQTVEPADPLGEEATAPTAADEQAPKWEQADLSAEVDQLLAELGVAPRRNEEPAAAGGEVVSTAIDPETAEPVELPAEDVIRNFTEALVKAVPTAEEYSTADVIAQSTEYPERTEYIAPAEPIIQEVAAKIDQIEPEAQQRAAEIIIKITEAVQKLENMPPVAAAEIRQEAEEELEELCLQLFAVIGHKADAQAVRDFVRIVQKMQLPASGELQTAEFIDYMHERKLGLLELPAPSWFAPALASSSAQSTAFGYLALGRASRTWVIA